MLGKAGPRQRESVYTPATIPPATIPGRAADADPKALPRWWHKLDGGLRLFVDSGTTSAIKPQPWITLAAGLAVFGTAAGRRYAGPTGVRSNIYAIGIGQSTSGKGHPLKWAQSALMQADLVRMLGGSAIASGAAMISGIEQNPVALYTIDEVHELMGAATGKERHLAEINKNLLTLYTTSDSDWLGTAYANTKEKPRVTVCQPCVSLFGVSTPLAFWNVFKSGAAYDGTLGRLMVFETDDSFPQRQAPDSSIIPAELVASVRAVAAGVPGHEHFPMGDGPSVRPSVWSVGYASEAAKQFARDVADGEDRLCRAHDGQPTVALIGRTSEQVQKLALIKAVAANPANPQLRLVDLEWAVDVHTIVRDRMMRAIQTEMADNPTEERVKRMAKVIRELSGPETLATASQITRACQSMSSRERLEALETLIEQGDVEQVPFNGHFGAGRPPRQYHWVGY